MSERYACTNWQKQEIHNIFIGHLSGSHFKSIYMYLKYKLSKFWGSRFFRKGMKIHTPGSPPSHHPGTDCPVFNVKCSLVNVTRRGTIINVCSWISHMSIMNILLINLFIMRSILFHNKGLWLSRWHFKIIFYIIFYIRPHLWTVIYQNVGISKGCKEVHSKKAWLKIGNGECSGRGLKIYYFSYHYKTIGQFLSQVYTLHEVPIGDQIGTGKGTPIHNSKQN